MCTRCGGAGPSHGAPQAPPYTELPVALVHAGCNMADHALTMRQLLHHLRRECSTHLAVLRSKECTNLAAATRSLVSQLLGPQTRVQIGRAHV